MLGVAVRLFAYGGSRYEVRNRIGEWPPDFADTASFEDLHALPLGGGTLAYGVGLRPTPALILRERQNEGDRGGYAYTVMLDPGREVWERFGWNGAQLLQAARADEPLWTALLREPERLVTTFLDSRLGQLSPGTDPARPFAIEPRLHDIASALVDAAVFPGRVVLDTGAAGDVSDPSVMASLLAALPPAFRCGRGWMVHGHGDSSRTFGTALVIDRGGSAGAGETPSPSTFDALVDVVSSQLSGRLDALLAVPVHEWPTDPERVARHWKLLAAAAVSGNADDEVAAITRDDLLADDLRRLLAARADVGPRWSNAASVWMLDGYDIPGAIPPAVVRRLDLRALAEYLWNRGLTAADSRVAALGLQEREAHAVWDAQVRLAPARRTVPLVAEAVAHVGFTSPSETLPDRLCALFDAAMKRPTADRPRLREWQALSQDASLWRALAPLLTEALRAERMEGDDEWILDYLALGDDPGGIWLASTYGADALKTVVGVALARVADSHIGSSARDWLDALARSTVRRRLPLAMKLQVARAIDGSWRPLTLLMDLLEGERVLTPLRADGPESAALLDELRERVTEYVQQARDVPAGAVDLERIASLVNVVLPSELVEQIVGRFRLGDRSIAWLREQGHAQLAMTALQADWRNLRETCARSGTEEVASILRTIADRRGPADDLLMLLSWVDPAALETVLPNDHGLRSWLAATLFDPRAPLPQVAPLVDRFTAATWTALLDALADRGPQKLLDTIGVLERTRLPGLGRVIFDYIAERAQLREALAIKGWGSTWREARDGIQAALVPVAPDEPQAIPDVPESASPQRPKKTRKRR